MDERECPSIAVLAAEVARPMFYGFMIGSPFLLLQGSALPRPLFATIGVLWGASLILGIVRWINWRAAPQRSMPDDAANASPRDSE